MAAFYLQRYFSLVNWRTVLRAGDDCTKTASQAKCLHVNLLISSFHEDLRIFFFPHSALGKSSWTNLPTEAEILLGIKGARPTPVVLLAALPFACRDTQQGTSTLLLPMHPIPESRLSLSNRAHHEYLSTFLIKKRHLQSWRILKLQERASGRQCSTEQHLNIKFATGLFRQPRHLIDFHGTPSFRSFVFPGCL